MRIRSWLVAGALFAPCAAGAQTTTADGVQALVRGDYPLAAGILRPLAEEAPQPDALAQFFMAMLYGSGKGVALNPIRACGLYLRAATGANPLMNASLDLARHIQLVYGPMDAQLCASAGALGWQDAPSASFTLAQDHSVTIDQNGVTVVYKGTQNRIGMPIGGPGFVYLPSRLTQLDVSHPVDARRSFIESFIWQPDTSYPPVWTLGWIVNEVVGPALLPAAGDSRLLTAVGPQPPASFDAGSTPHVRVNANGEAEWIVPGGPNPRSGVIPFKGPR